jgi:hypothetical protein
VLLEAGRGLSRRRESQGYLVVEALIAARRDRDVAALMRDYTGERVDWVAGLVQAGQASGDLDAALSPGAVAHFCLLLAMGSLVVTPDLHGVDEAEWAALLTRVVRALVPSEQTPAQAEQSAVSALATR